MGTYTDPALILPGAVGQTEVDATLKRDTALGVAGLDATGRLLVLSSYILIARNVINNVVIIERTSGETVCYYNRVGPNDYEGYVQESGVVKRVQTESMKNIASGIAGLDGDALVNLANLPEFYSFLEQSMINANFTVSKYVDVSGTDIFHAHDAEAVTSAETMTKLKTITPAQLLLRDGTAKLFFALKGTSATDAGYGQIYVNGSPVGTLRERASINYLSYTETITGLSVGDTIELWGRHSVGEAGDATVKEFRILGSVTTTDFSTRIANS